MNPEPARRGPSLADRASKAAELESRKYDRVNGAARVKAGENFWGYHRLFKDAKKQGI